MSLQSYAPIHALKFTRISKRKFIVRTNRQQLQSACEFGGSRGTRATSSVLVAEEKTTTPVAEEKRRTSAMSAVYAIASTCLSLMTECCTMNGIIILMICNHARNRIYQHSRANSRATNSRVVAQMVYIFVYTCVYFVYSDNELDNDNCDREH